MPAPRKQTAFRLPDETLRELDAIAKTLPLRGRLMPATRNDAVIHATRETFERLAQDAAEGRQGE